MTNTIAYLLLLSFAGTLTVGQAIAWQKPDDKPDETLIRNATVLTITHGTLQNADVLIRKGKIAGVGKNLKASTNARVIDGTGKYVMPGIIDCHSHSMLDAINEGSVAVSSMAHTSDVLNPTDVDLYRELA